MKNFTKQMILWNLTAALAGSCLTAIPFVSEAKTTGTQTLLSAEELSENDELFAGYVNQLFYGGLNGGIATCGNVGNEKLTTKESKQFYNGLKEKVKLVAAGELESTKLQIDMDVTWTFEELGIESLFQDDAGTAILNKFMEKFQLNEVISSLMMDCPYEMYWFDKTSQSSMPYTMTYTSNSITITGITAWLPVASEYQYQSKDDEEDNTYRMNTSLIAGVKAAKENADKIVEEQEGKSDYEKMKAYKNAICELNSYNYEAADSNIYTPYGNPWQMIWVFDGDPETNVVCEGYSKSFQYLCDLSDITCYTVTGIMESSTVSGGHMWNVVPMEGQNYLVDVTNCDGYLVTDELFLAGGSGSVDKGYTFSFGSDELKYTYYTSDLELLGEDILTIASERYVYDPNANTGNEENKEDQEKLTAAKNAAKAELVKYNDEELEGCADVSAYYAQVDALKTASEIDGAVEDIKGQMLDEVNANISTYIAAKTGKASSYASKYDTLLGSKLEDFNTFYQENIVTLRNAKSKSEADAAYTEFIKKLDEKATELMNAPVQATGITLNKTSISLEVGGSETLIAVVSPDDAADKTVAWSSDNESVATVTNGTIMAVSAGTAEITAKTADLTAKCVVTVSEKEQEAEKPDDKGDNTGNDDKEPVVFHDVSEDAWYHSYVQYVASRGLMNGYEGNFTPDGTMTRAMLVETLYRMSGTPAVKNYGKYFVFDDLEISAWYADSVAWALNEGIATGDPVANKFNPDASVTREQLAAFLYRYAQYTEKDVSLSKSEDVILGDTPVQDWARTEFAWTIDQGLISGLQKTDGAGNVTYDLAPRGTATRAQLATILQRYCENIQ